MAGNEDLLRFFKAMADANRMKIVGLLARQAYTVEQLAALLGIGASTVSHHLSKLADAGLVSASAQSYYNYYRLEENAVEQYAQRLLSVAALSVLAAEVGSGSAEEVAAAAYDRKILHDYLTAEGQLKTIPSQRKKLMVILRHLAQAFEPGVSYAEREVNATLEQYNEDTASLRRELIGARLMARNSDGSRYWRTEEP